MNEASSSVRALTCPGCGAPLEVRAAGQSVSVICGHCGSTVDANNPDLKVIRAAHEALKKPQIALGARAMLRGEEWEAVGYVERSDGDAEWAEYLLFNPYLGYAFLVDGGNGWSLGKLMAGAPDRLMGKTFAMHEGKLHQRLAGNPYKASVTFAVGEFYWRVKVGEEVRVTEFTRPGVMLSHEANDAEQTWTRLVPLDRGEAERAFGIPVRAWFSHPPLPHAISPHASRLAAAAKIAAVAGGCLLLMALVGNDRDKVFQKSVAITMDQPEQTVVLGPVEIDRYQAVNIDTFANLSNEWVDIDYSLVNLKTQESYPAYALLERYHGGSTEGMWSEGKEHREVRLSSVPPGSYDLVADISGKRWDPGYNAGSWWVNPTVDPGPASVTATVTRGGQFLGNVLTALVMIMLWPISLALFHYSFEQRRREEWFEE